MTDFPLSREQWYAQRDDRTRLLEGVTGFDRYSVGVIIDEHLTSLFNIQVMTLTALNILSRWCRKIRVQIRPDTKCVLPGTRSVTLSSVIEKTVRDSDPYIDFSLGSVSEPDFNQILLIGAPTVTLMEPQVSIAGGGWLAGVGLATSVLETMKTFDLNPVGPAFSACLGVAELFRTACGAPYTGDYKRWYSLLDFTEDDAISGVNDSYPFPNSLSLGRLYQIGCGAVGSCLDYFLSFTAWSGVLHLIDYDCINIDNCNRSLSFTAEDAVRSIRKTESCSKVLKGSSIATSVFNGDYSEFISAGNYLTTPPDAILSLANERHVWEVIQQNFPPLVLHSSTSPNWNLNFGRHVPKNEWCIFCRFSKESKSRFVPVCAQGQLPLPPNASQPNLGVLPFLSPAAAILILSELAKTSFRDYPLNENFIQFSMRFPNSSFLKMTRESDPSCICGQQPLSQYPDEIKSTKFWHLTQDKFCQ